MTAAAATNPLVAARHDSTTWYSGLGLVEDIGDLESAVRSGSWVDGVIGGVGAGLDALAYCSDPLGSIASWGVAWLFEHVKPLSDALDWLAGDPDQISAYAQTWRNVGRLVGTQAAAFAAGVDQDLSGWTGEAAEKYRGWADRQRHVLDQLAKSAQLLGTVVEVAGTVVALVRQLVRDLIADFVSALAVRLWEWLAEEGATLGAATALVTAQVAALVAKWMGKIGRLVTALAHSLEKLRPILRRIGVIFESLDSASAKLHRTPYGGRTSPMPATDPLNPFSPGWHEGLLTPSAGETAPSAPHSEPPEQMRAPKKPDPAPSYRDDPEPDGTELAGARTAPTRPAWPDPTAWLKDDDLWDLPEAPPGVLGQEPRTVPRAGESRPHGTELAGAPTSATGARPRSTGSWLDDDDPWGLAEEPLAVPPVIGNDFGPSAAHHGGSDVDGTASSGGTGPVDMPDRFTDLPGRPGPRDADLAPPRTFASDAEGAEYGTQTWSNAQYKLNAVQRQALWWYTGDKFDNGSGWPPDFRNINGALRGDSPMTVELQAVIDHIDEATRLRPLPENVVVLRETGWDAFNCGEAQLPGSLQRDAAFLSTSIGRYAESFPYHPVVLHLEVPAGTPAIYVEGISQNPGERELILGRGLSYTVDHIEPGADGRPHIYGRILGKE